MHEPYPPADNPEVTDEEGQAPYIFDYLIAGQLASQATPNSEAPRWPEKDVDAVKVLKNNVK